QGVGLARMEFIINDLIKVHPLALTRFDQVSDPAVREEILALTAGYADLREYFVERLARGVATITASQYPHPTIVRMSAFKPNRHRKMGAAATATRERLTRVSRRIYLRWQTGRSSTPHPTTRNGAYRP